MCDIAIVAVGYNRPDSMNTLLKSIGEIKTENDVDLVISIDKGKRQKEIIDVANQFSWSHGEKLIRAFGNRQGLRNHIIECGDLTEKYEAVVVLEDDLIVSPFCISYVEQAIQFYKNDARIAGISLYKHLFHPGVARPFEATNNGFDAFLMQFAQSWGQCWTRQMWQGFKEWYLNHENMNLSEGDVLPSYISGWNEHSWLKYYMRYIVEKDKYFVYPTVSLSSNASDVGQHCSIPNNDYQVPLLMGYKEFQFPTVDRAVIYDVYFERKNIKNEVFHELKGNKIIDLYGCRNSFNDAEYIISTQILPYAVDREIALCYRPIEQNLLTPMQGEGIYVYNASVPSNITKSNVNLITRYDVKGIHWKKLLKLGVSEFLDAIKNRIKKR